MAVNQGTGPDEKDPESVDERLNRFDDLEGDPDLVDDTDLDVDEIEIDFDDIEGEDQIYDEEDPLMETGDSA